MDWKESRREVARGRESLGKITSESPPFASRIVPPVSDLIEVILKF
jgi:hypothetical protein